MGYKYKFKAEGEVNLPEFGLTVKQGQVFETDKEINNPDFELIKEQPDKAK